MKLLATLASNTSINMKDLVAIESKLTKKFSATNFEYLKGSGILIFIVPVGSNLIAIKKAIAPTFVEVEVDGILKTQIDS